MHLIGSEYRSFINIFTRTASGFHSWAKYFGPNFLLGLSTEIELFPRGSNQVGKILLTAN